MVDTHASRACDRKVMRVQVPPPAQISSLSPFYMKSALERIVWTPDIAYIVGLLVTDGNLSKDGRHIIMKSSDQDLLVTFKKSLSLKNIIAVSKNNGFAKKTHYRIQFGNILFYQWLLSIGLFPNKTYTIGKILIPNQYFRDFLRGHLDGDGTILTYQDKYNNYRGRIYENLRLYVKLISASEEHIRWLQEKVYILTGLRGSTSQSIPTKNRVPLWEIKFAKKESLKLLKYIYYKKDLPCLHRKMLIAKNSTREILNEKRKTYERI